MYIVLIRHSTVLFSYSALGCKSVLINQSINQHESAPSPLFPSPDGSRSVLPFLLGSPVWPTQRPTHRPRKTCVN